MGDPERGQENLGVADVNRLNEIHGSKYRISLDHQILTDYGVFYPYALENYLVFALILTPASPIKRDANTQKNIKISTPRQPIKATLLLFVEQYAAGARDSEKSVYPDLRKVNISIDGYPNSIYNNGLEREDMWPEASCFFVKKKTTNPGT